MSDEERRLVEREARYSERLAAFLVCLREDHVPKQHPLGFPCSLAAFHDGSLRVCDRCHLSYFHKIETKVNM